MKQKPRELEEIAQHLKGKAIYGLDDIGNDNTIEYLSYNDDKSGIVARNDFKDEYGKIISYRVDEIKLEEYLKNLKATEGDLPKKLIEDLSKRKENKESKKSRQNFVCTSISVENFEGVSDLIKMHLRLKSY